MLIFLVVSLQMSMELNIDLIESNCNSMELNYELMKSSGCLWGRCSFTLMSYPFILTTC